MGIGIVLVFWAVIGTVVAVIGACVLGGISFLLTKRVVRGRWPFVLACCAFPFLCLPWGGLVFGFQAIVNETVLHRDAGLGDTWRCPLPNGYAIMMIDLMESGWVYNPKTQSFGGVSEQEDAVSGVQELQLFGPLILGKRDVWGEGGPEQNKAKISYFVLDTTKGKRTEFASYEAFGGAVTGLGVSSIRLEPIETLYRRYRLTWFDGFAAFLFFVPPLVALVGLALWLLKVRKRVAVTEAISAAANS